MPTCLLHPQRKATQATRAGDGPPVPLCGVCASQAATNGRRVDPVEAVMVVTPDLEPFKPAEAAR